MLTILRQLKSFFRRPIQAFDEQEVPLRAALFGLEHLEGHARILADDHVVDPTPQPDRLLRRLGENEQIIQLCYQSVSESVQQGLELAPAAEWLLDNLYLIEDHFETARRDLPKNYARQLPRLKTGKRRGYPRVYDIAFELVSHTDGRLDVENVTRFVRAYQTDHPLELGELWAVPIMIRLALLENLRRVSHRIAWRRKNRDAAAKWTQRFLRAAHKEPKRLILVLADFVRENPPITRPFITELFTQLQGQHISLGSVLHWLEAQLADSGQTMDQVIQAESQEQASDHVSIGNTITSLRFLATCDWHEFVEDLSVVEEALRRDPSEAYARMDFHTRDQYRHVVEDLSRHSEAREQDVAALAVRLSGDVEEPDLRRRHVGYWLWGRGRLRLEEMIDYRAPLRVRAGRLLTSCPTATYLGAVAAVSLALTAGVLAAGATGGVSGGLWQWFLTGLLVLLVASQSAISLSNWIITLLLGPKRLPRMDFAKGIPESSRTAVVVPAMLSSQQEVSNLLQGLEIRYLGNRDPNLLFVLLSDFPDSDTESLPGDSKLLEAARKGIEQLNARYAAGEDIFCLLHRPRRWNDSENKWMGYERKRGKLEDFNELALHGNTDPFSLIAGDVAMLGTIRYVIVLDADTQLPPQAGWKMAGAMAHPLNRPVLDLKTRRVVEGHGILQPRTAVSLPTAGRSFYTRLYSGEVGINPYTREVSNVYHDLFGEGAFIGKGIYDVRTFAAALSKRFPDNCILSHDLLEGCYTRCGFLNDVELIEEHPSCYMVEMSRRRRWIRGDWQIVRWLMPQVPTFNSTTERNPLTALGQWQILDNLRRSLVLPAILALLILGWLVLPGSPVIWTAATLALLFLPSLLRSAHALTQKPRGALVGWHLRKTLQRQGAEFAQELMTLVCLPYEAWMHLEAIGRVLYRKAISHRHLLEWQTVGDAERKTRQDLPNVLRSMWISPLGACAAAAVILRLRPEALESAGALLAAWLVAPVVTWWLSRPIVRRRARLSEDQHRFLARLARRTWRYFEHFVGPEHNWLPPDNYQEHPVERAAARTSPTNIGLYLLSNLAACDFGYIPVAELLDRTRNTFETMRKMERFRGHFFNWYDTRTCKPIDPSYISAVDSGNLSASLLTLRGGLDEIARDDLLPRRWREGLRDTLSIVLEETDGALRDSEDSGLSSQLRTLKRAGLQLQERLGQEPSTMPEIADLLRDVESAVSTVRPNLPGLHKLDAWIECLLREVQSLHEDLLYLAPWLTKEIDGDPWRQQAAEAGLESGEIEQLLGELLRMRPLGELISLQRRLEGRVAVLADVPATVANPSETWSGELLRRLGESGERAARRVRLADELSVQCNELREMETAFLYDRTRKLMRIGFHVTTHRFDTGYYDLLASEARLGSFVAVAEGKLPYEQWFMLSRQQAPENGVQTLVSWSGSMFEYLMPLLVMPNYEGTLLDQTYKGAVRRQIHYGRRRGVPWGMSESGFNLVDGQLNYQYRAFGVPELGLKRGLGTDLVVAPYASALALMISTPEACRNLQRLARDGLVGDYGLYEAVDYTPVRLPKRQNRAIVRSFMSHHSSMSLLGLAYTLLDRPMQRRFAADPQVRASLLLLQERLPAALRSAGLARRYLALGERAQETRTERAVARVYTDANTTVPEVHLLSNGRYHVMITSAGAGYVRWNDLALTRWREDVTRDCWGMFCYIRDTESKRFWSCTYQPTCRVGEQYEAVFSQGTAEFRRREDLIEAHTRISVSPEDDIEVRRVTLTNLSRRPRTLELTSYAEVVLAEPRAEENHPVFNNLFVQTEILSDEEAVLCTRRQRSPDDKAPWMFHTMIVQETRQSGEPSYETDRAKFVGRGRSPVNPLAMTVPGKLGNSCGAVLDPIVSVRRRIRLEPGDSVVADIITGVADTRDQSLSLLQKYRDRRLVQRVFEIAWTHSQVLLHNLRATEDEAQMYAQLAGAILFANPSLRASPSVIARNRKGQPGLWSYGISGDLPIVLLRISERDGLGMIRQLVQGHAYWRNKGLRADLVIWTEAVEGYRQALRDEVVGLVATGPDAHLIDRPGGIHIRAAEQVPEDDRLLFQSVAKIVLSDHAGTIAEQMARRPRTPLKVPEFPSAKPAFAVPSPPKQLERKDLLFFNGIGGFTADGREYVITIQPGLSTPAPWSNVLANPFFGSVVTESGGGYTWFENAHEYRLTPWYNDPVQDTPGEAFYIRDEQTGRFWSPTPLPAPGKTGYICRHGLGYTAFEHTENGIFTEMTQYVVADAPAKLILFNLRNDSGRSRRISVTGYFELVLGESRSRSCAHVVTRVDPQTGAILAFNPFQGDNAGNVAFVQCSETDCSLTADRAEFLGRNGSPSDPAALHRRNLSNRVGASMDPCAAFQTYVDLPPGQERQLTFMIGAAHSEQEARDVIVRYVGAASARQALDTVCDFWKDLLGVVYVETPDPAFDFLTNHWMLYQTLSCRMWGRSGFYQSGGAFGFRDQLQDSLALLHSRPDLTRAHLLTCAGRQFRDGDVQHWWHPGTGRGIRSRMSDDELWLPYVTCAYVGMTGDTGVLDELVPFIEGRQLNKDEDFYYDLPRVSDEQVSLYEHCVRAIEHGLNFGARGLPLIGGGDWNDGMNRVGAGGKGESVWLGFFLYDVLQRFSELAQRRKDETFAGRCRDSAQALGEQINRHGWDGQWYRRAFFDDGQILGSTKSPECKIDSISQSWSVLSGAGEPDRSESAMAAVEKHLVREDLQLIKLLDPPFDRADWDPGYIQGYVPGVRENGGQYTHAAIWTVIAFARMRKAEKAWRLFNMINPIRHGLTPEDIETYKVEPYVVAADVYTAAGHEGRGGWTWYTGSAGWMYNLLVEHLLGLKLTVDKLKIAPLVPAEWKEFRVHYRYRGTFYHMDVQIEGPQTWNVRRMVVDGIDAPDLTVHLIDDRQDHWVEITVG